VNRPVQMQEKKFVFSSKGLIKCLLLARTSHLVFSILETRYHTVCSIQSTDPLCFIAKESERSMKGVKRRGEVEIGEGLAGRKKGVKMRGRGEQDLRWEVHG